MRARGANVVASLRDLSNVEASLRAGIRVLHSLPPEAPDPLPLLTREPGAAPARVVYLSTTGVYGAATEVDEHTAADWSSERARPRLEVEARVAAGPWSSLILRPAAIYGPGRGIHESLKKGVYHPGDNIVSRIHVEDLAACVEAALLCDVTGAYPVADEEPCTAREIAAFCAELLGMKDLPQTVPARITANRRVDGSAIRRLLGVELKYPSYRVGIPASLTG